MNTKDVGTLGEHIAILELLRHDISVSRPLGDNKQYDLILDIKGFLLRCQVKSKTTATEDKVEFSLHTTNRSGDRVRYSEVDCYCLVDVTNNRVFLVDHDDSKVSIILRYKIPECRNKSQIKMAEDFTIPNFINSLP